MSNSCRLVLLLLLAGFACGCGSEKNSRLEESKDASKAEVQSSIESEPQADAPLGNDDSYDRIDFVSDAKSYHCVAVSPDGLLLAAGSETQGISVWDTQTRKLKCVLQGHKVIVSSVAFSPDSKLILSSSRDETVRLWSVATGKELRSFGEDLPMYLSAVFMPDGKRVLIANGSDSKLTRTVQNPLMLYDLKTGDLLKGFGGEMPPIEDLFVSRDGKTVATSSTVSGAYVWNVKLGTHKLFKQPGAIESVALSPDGKTLIAGNSRGIVTVWDLETDTADYRPMHVAEETGLESVFEQVTAVAISPDGTWMASGGWSKRVCLWEPTGDWLYHWDLDHWVSGIAFHPVSNHAYASTWSGRVVELIPSDEDEADDTE